MEGFNWDTWVAHFDYHLWEYIEPITIITSITLYTHEYMHVWEYNKQTVFALYMSWVCYGKTWQFFIFVNRTDIYSWFKKGKVHISPDIILTHTMVYYDLLNTVYTTILDDPFLYAMTFHDLLIHSLMTYLYIPCSLTT